MDHLHSVDFVINLMPNGEDFLASRLQEFIPQTAAIIDFSRPAISEKMLPQKVYLGNRIRRSDMRFVFALPGGWKQRQLPACALPALLAALTGQVSKRLESFCLLARQQAFGTALVDAPLGYQGTAKSLWNTPLWKVDFELGDDLDPDVEDLLFHK
ncbi:MAG: hypothetical protein GQ559_09260 [Desulfobulbaceae bacterium]|nr:hypothetical protein [Desulfobulbaceae bacterium]